VQHTAYTMAGVGSVCPLVRLSVTFVGPYCMSKRLKLSLSKQKAEKYRVDL